MTTAQDSSFLNEHVYVSVRVRVRWRFCVSLRLSPRGDTATFFFTSRRIGAFLAKAHTLTPYLTHAPPTRTAAEHIAVVLLRTLLRSQKRCVWWDDWEQQRGLIGFQPSPNTGSSKSVWWSLFTRLPSYRPLYIQQSKHFQTGQPELQTRCSLKL